MNGLEVLHWVRENYGERDVAVYLLTSSEDPSHRRQAADDRVTEFLSKSYRTDQLSEKLDGFIERNNRQFSEGLSASPGVNIALLQNSYSQTTEDDGL
jgi:CheY-like chemotaxis protein